MKLSLAMWPFKNKAKVIVKIHNYKILNVINQKNTFKGLDIHGVFKIIAFEG